MKLISLVIPLLLKNESVFCFGQTRKSSDEFNGFFEFPGGKIEKGESPLLAAQREILEETGIVLEKSDLDLGFIWNDFLSPEKAIRFYVYFTKKDFDKAKGEYLPLEEVCRDSFKIPPINKLFLREYHNRLKNYLRL